MTAAPFTTSCSIGIFSRSDADCVDQMFGEAYSKPGEDNYRFLSCWEDESTSMPIGNRQTLVNSTMLGFACYGRESLTQGAWDLFWICVSGAARRKGAGRALLAEVQHRAAQERVRLIVIYTSSTDKYAAARGLYESLGFTRTAVVPDYYADGDDLIIYTKRITRKE
jgi:ribosomal protein S18 acetylase RimI-like enzyme